jgi:hypothetical protein
MGWANCRANRAGVQGLDRVSPSSLRLAATALMKAAPQSAAQQWLAAKQLAMNEREPALRAVSEQPLKLRQIPRSRDQQDIPDARASMSVVSDNRLAAYRISAEAVC